MPDETNTTEQQSSQPPVVIKQGGNGLGTIVAALIIAAVAIYAINVWSTIRKETAPGRNLEKGIERIKDAASKAADQRQ
jgi:uncharacterized protein HemX